MDIQSQLVSAFKVASFDQATIKKVVTEKNIRVGLAFLALSSLAAAIGPMLFPISYAPGLYFQPDLARIIGLALFSFLNNAILLFVVGWAAEEQFNSKIDRFAFVTVMGYGHIVGLLALIPDLRVFSGVWIAVLFFYVLRKNSKLDWGAIALLVLILLVTCVLLNWLGNFLGMDGPWGWGRASLF